ncbi:fimbrial protein [Salmonella enterica subsp. enterica]|nr:fimbrial protein [Salmonella enterica subsp. enterica]
MSKLTKVNYLYGFMLVTMMLLPGALRADSSVQFHGTLIAASCTPESVNVEFGDVSLDKISSFKSGTQPDKSVFASSPSQQMFALKLNCTGDVDGIEYKWSGNVVNGAYLATDMNGLVIQIGDGDTYTITIPDMWWSMDSSSKEKDFIAVLMKDSGATFAGGEFNATATFAIRIP